MSGEAPKDLASALATAFPPRAFRLPDGGRVVAIETPACPVFERSAILVGQAGDGYPLALRAPLPEGRRLTAEFVAEAAASTELRELWNERFNDFLDDFDAHMLRIMAPRSIEGMAQWAEARYGKGPGVRESVGRHVFENPLMAEEAARLQGRDGSPGPRRWSGRSLSARQWHRVHGAEGPAGPGTWIRRLCEALPTFSERVLAAARLRECPLREDFSDERNVVAVFPAEAGESRADTRRLERLVRRISEEDAANEPLDGPKVFRMLSQCPEDWWPKDTPSWQAAGRIAGMVSALQSVTRFPARQLVSPCKGRWEWWCDALARIDPNFTRDEAGGTSRVDLEAGGENVDDLLAAFFSQVIYPAMRLGNPDAVGDDAVAGYVSAYDRYRGEAAKVLFGQASAAGIMEASVKWHLNRPQMEADLAALSPEFSQGRSWDAGLPEQFAMVGKRRFEIVPLTSQAMLADEGRRGPDRFGMDGLDHCVGTLHYVALCLAGSCRVVSLREIKPDGSRIRLSTAEFRYRPGDMADGVDRGELMLVQHRGRANGAPPPPVDDVLRHYHKAVAGVRDGGPNLPIDHGAFVRVEEPTSIGTVAGYDAERPELVEGALRLWEPFLKRPLRGLDLADFVDRCGIARRSEPQRGPRT